MDDFSVSSHGNKAEVIAEEILKLSPIAKIEVFKEGVTEENLSRFIEKGTIVIDGIDLFELKIKSKMFILAHERGLPVFSGPILGWGASILVFHPKKSPTFIDYFGKVPENMKSPEFIKYMEEYTKKYFLFWPKLDIKIYLEKVRENKPPSIGTSTMLAGLLLANATVDYLLKLGNFPIVPSATHIDLMQLKIVKSGRFRRLVFNWIFDLRMWFNGIYLKDQTHSKSRNL